MKTTKEYLDQFKKYLNPKKAIQGTIMGAALIVLPSLFCYADVVGLNKLSKQGRARNGIATVISTAVADQLYDNATFKFDVKKTRWPDAEVTGTVSEDSVHAYLPVWFSSSRFNATKDENGKLAGEVIKSEFNWKVAENSPGLYDITRWGLKLNSTLNLKAEDGRINGTYVRPGLKFDWKISGKYDSQGNTSVDVDIPFGTDISLEGKIQSK